MISIDSSKSIPAHSLGTKQKEYQLLIFTNYFQYQYRCHWQCLVCNVKITGWYTPNMNIVLDFKIRNYIFCWVEKAMHLLCSNKLARDLKHLNLEEWEKWFNVTTSPKLAMSWNTAALSSPGMAFNRTLAAIQLRSNSSTVLIMYEFTSLSINSSFLNNVLRRWPKAQSGSVRPTPEKAPLHY